MNLMTTSHQRPGSERRQHEEERLSLINNSYETEEASSPDCWIRRDPSLIRLTGPFPFNAEPPLCAMMEGGLITPNSLHFVRNHGGVPRLDWNSHKLTIDGLVKNPCSFTMQQLKEDSRFVELSLVNTITCDGNRRKEVNSEKRSRGVNWGAGGTGTARWTGVTLASLLKAVGIKIPEALLTNAQDRGQNTVDVTQLPRYVCFEGADSLLHGNYGTSVPLSWALDEERQFLIAYMMNDEPLPPDHGFPIRLVLPGFIGGRQVKWLQRITISAYESPSYWHYEDNRKLPSHVDWTVADTQGWWYRPEYLLYELNINSVITSPEHLEVVEVFDRGETAAVKEDQSKTKEALKDDQPQTSAYTLRGYAYSGGGRRITSVEVSIDDGNTWLEASNLRFPDHYTRKISRDNSRQSPEQLLQEYLNAATQKQQHQEQQADKENSNSKSNGPQKNNVLICSSGPGSHAMVEQDRDWRSSGRVFCWCHWTLEIPVWKLITTKYIIVRAFDESGNTQPRDCTWSILGTFNNSWYKVQVDIDASGSSETSFPSIAFRHPVQPGGLPGGWLKNNAEHDMHQPRPLNDLRHPLVPTSAPLQRFTIAEVKRHNKLDDCWITIEGEVYDVTSYLRDHPAGPVPIQLVSGERDATQLFHQIHAPDAFRIKDWFKIGVLAIESLDGVPDADQRSPHQQQLQRTEDHTAAVSSGTILDPKRWIHFRLTKKESLSHDTYKFTLTAGEERAASARFDLPVGNHVLIGANMQVEGKTQWIVRPYTPTYPCTEEEDDGRNLELVIKVYRKNKNRFFPEGGMLTQYLETLGLGSPVLVQGPAGHIIYHGYGRFTVHGISVQVERISLLCGGTGITPMWQLVDAILSNDQDRTQIAMIYSNKTPDDILMRTELDQLVRDHGHDNPHPDDYFAYEWKIEKALSQKPPVCIDARFHLWYTCSQVNEPNWRYGSGHVNEHMMRKHIHVPGLANAVFLCGPPSFIDMACFPALHRLGYDNNRIFEF